MDLISYIIPNIYRNVPILGSNRLSVYIRVLIILHDHCIEQQLEQSTSDTVFPLYRLAQLSYWIGLLFPLDCSLFSMIIVWDSSWIAPFLKLCFHYIGLLFGSFRNDPSHFTVQWIDVVGSIRYVSCLNLERHDKMIKIVYYVNILTLQSNQQIHAEC